MPRGDGTGPRGMGSRTGRGAGYCAGFGVPGYTNAGPGGGWCGMGFGRRGGGRRGGGSYGGGRGWGQGFGASGFPGWPGAGWAGMASPPAPNWGNEKEILQAQAEAMQNQLGEIKKRLDELANQEDKT